MEWDSTALRLRRLGYKTFPSFFEGGVAGIADFEMFTIKISRPGWLN